MKLRLCTLGLAICALFLLDPPPDGHAQELPDIDTAELPSPEPEETREQIETTIDRIEAKGQVVWRRLPLWGIALGVILIFALLAKLLASWTWPFRLISRRPLIQGLIAQVAGSLLFLLGAVFALELIDATKLVGAVLGAAGVMGLALGFAFRDIIENYLASVLMALRRPFSAGDHIVLEGREGKVMRMTMRETILMTLEGNHLRIPNAVVFKAVIENYTLNPLRRFDFVTGIGAHENLAGAQQIGLDALADVPGVMAEPPPFARVESLGEWAVNVRFHAWVDQRQADIYKVSSEALRRVKESLDAAGVDLPPPTQRLERARPAAAAVSPGRAHMTEDVAPDHYLEAQMEADQAREVDENLLVNQR